MFQHTNEYFFLIIFVFPLKVHTTITLTLLITEAHITLFKYSKWELTHACVTCEGKPHLFSCINMFRVSIYHI